MSAPALCADSEIVGDFILESTEHLDSAEQHLLLIEKDLADSESIHSVFRAFHSIKGLAGFLEFEAILAVAHETENVLERVRSGQEAAAAMVDTVLLAVDYLRECIGILSRSDTGCYVFPSHEQLIRRIQFGSEAETAEEASLTFCRPAETQPTVKVERRKLDLLLERIGELSVSSSSACELVEEIRRIAHSMRTVPIGQLFAKMERVVRDLARRSGKHIVLHTAGEFLELDRATVEQLADPIVHMIRNSVDHGIEQGGVIRLSAELVGSDAVIRVADNGRGLSKEKILSKAMRCGLVAIDASLSESEIFQLIFQPGLSTSSEVTPISGRGVGMDIVLKQITKLHGRIDIQSQAGAGCVFSIYLPLPSNQL